MNKSILSLAAEHAGITEDQARLAVTTALRSLHKVAVVDPKGLASVALETYSSFSAETCYHLFGLLEVERKRQDHEVPWSETLMRIDSKMKMYDAVVDHWLEANIVKNSQPDLELSHDEDELLESLLEFVRDNRRICPLPRKWDELWRMLPKRRRTAQGGWDPALPLILGAWDMPALPKMLRLREHIEYAASHGVLDKVDTFLRNLREDDWAHI